MICPNCGKETSPFAKFCEVCGTALPELSAAQEAVQETAAPQPTEVQPPMTAAPPTPVQPADYQQPTSYQQQPAAFQQSTSYQQQPAAQPIYQAQADQFPEATRYQEYGMGDVVAQKKSHKKLIIAIVAVLVVISLVVAGFFIYRLIKKNAVMSKIKDEPTAYLVGAYQETAAAFSSQDEVLNITHSAVEHGTIKTKMDMGETGSMNGTIAYDKNSKQLYYSTALTRQDGTNSAELYADLDKVVVNASDGNTPVDYYLELKDLRAKAATSDFGPQSPAGSRMTQEQYDAAMDVYEYIYNNLTRDDENYFGLKTLGDALCKDIDEGGKVEVADGSTDVFGTNADAYVVTHTFKDTSVLNAVYLDVKNWAKENVNINEQVNQSVLQALEKIDPIQYTENLGQTEYEVTIKHYINKDKGTIMKAEFSVTYQKQTVSLTLLFGADPASSDKIGVEINAVGISQKVTVTRMSDASQAKYEIKCYGAVLNGDITYTRDKSTGDFTITQDLKSAYGGQSSSLPATQPLTGNLKNTFDTVTLTLDIPVSGENTAKVEYSISNKAEIKVLTSNNDILKASREELQQNLPTIASALSGVTPISAISNTNSATVSVKESNAKVLEEACKTLYAGVASGVLNSDTPQDELFTLDASKLPARGSTVATNKEAANQMTIQDAINYVGVSSQLNADNIGEYGYDSYGSIYYLATADTNCTPLTLETTLGEIRGSY